MAITVKMMAPAERQKSVNLDYNQKGRERMSKRTVIFRNPVVCADTTEQPSQQAVLPELHRFLCVVTVLTCLMQ